jgi:hypothetical protein
MEYIRRPPGAKAELIAEVERAYALALPIELRKLWTDSNGPILWFGYKELQFFPVSDVLEDIYSVKQFMPGALPLCGDGNSNLCVGKVVNGELQGYYVAACSNLAWDDARLIANSWHGFIDDGLSPEARLNT